MGAFTLVAVALLLVSACGSSKPPSAIDKITPADAVTDLEPADTGPAVGTEGGNCFPNLACYTGLTCVANRCVAAGSDIVEPDPDLPEQTELLDGEADSADATMDAADGELTVEDVETIDPDAATETDLGSPLKKPGEACAADEECQSNACKTILDQTQKVCSPDAESCVYLDANAPTFTKTGHCTGATTVRVCSKGAWLDETSCGFDRPSCAMDKCVFCAPGEFFCTRRNVAALCSGDGLAIASTYTCPGPKICAPGLTGFFLEDKCADPNNDGCTHGTVTDCERDGQPGFWRCMNTGVWEFQACGENQFCLGHGACVDSPYSLLYPEASKNPRFPMVAPVTSGATTQLLVGIITQEPQPGGFLMGIYGLVWNPETLASAPVPYFASPQTSNQWSIALDGKTGVTCDPQPCRSAFVSWMAGSGTTESKLLGQWIDNEGQRVGDPVPISETKGAYYGSDNVVFGENKVLVVWREHYGSGQLLAKLNLPTDVIKPVTGPGISTDDPRVALVGPSSFIVTWRASNSVFVQCLSSDLTLVPADGALKLSVPTVGTPVVAGAQGQNAVVLWSNASGIAFSFFDSACKQGETVSVLPTSYAQYYDVQMWADGRVAVLYMTIDADNPTNDGMFVKIYNNAGELTGDPLRVTWNTAWTPGERSFAVFGTKGIAVVWRSFDNRIFGRILQAP